MGADLAPESGRAQTQPAQQVATPMQYEAFTEPGILVNLERQRFLRKDRSH